MRSIVDGAPDRRKPGRIILYHRGPKLADLDPLFIGDFEAALPF